MRCSYLGNDHSQCDHILNRSIKLQYPHIPYRRSFQSVLAFAHIDKPNSYFFHIIYFLLYLQDIIQKLHTGHVESPHLIRQFAWNAWLHKIVKTPSTLSSIRSKHTGHVGNSVWFNGGNPSWPHSTVDTQTAWQTESGSSEL